MTTFGQRLKRARLEHGLTRSKAEDFAGIGHGTWAAYETGKSVPNFGNLSAISTILPRTNMHWLITGDGDHYLNGKNTRGSNAT